MKKVREWQVEGDGDMVKGYGAGKQRVSHPPLPPPTHRLLLTFADGKDEVVWVHAILCYTQQWCRYMVHGVGSWITMNVCGCRCVDSKGDPSLHIHIPFYPHALACTPTPAHTTHACSTYTHTLPTHVPKAHTATHPNIRPHFTCTLKIIFSAATAMSSVKVRVRLRARMRWK